MVRGFACVLLLGASILEIGHAATYEVGPGATFRDLNELLAAETLGPDDTVLLRGNTTYGSARIRSQHGGEPGHPTRIIGVNVNGLPPRFEGGVNTVHNQASYIEFENLDITGGSFRCFFHQGTGVVLRRVFVHDCPGNGILGADQDSGSLTIEYSAVVNAGANGGRHAIYMSTDQVRYPDSVFRLQFSYVSDSQFGTGEGGNLIKSRAERNEIYYNWLESGFYHELELIGPDPAGVADGWTESLAREDSDIVGNVILHTSDFGSILRLGGDATGQSFGRYRFVNNTVIRTGGGQATVFRLFDGLESLEASNNVFFNAGSSALRIVRETEANWFTGSTTIAGKNNWMESGSVSIPDGFTDSIIAADPKFSNFSRLDLRPAADSPLINSGVATNTSEPEFAIQAPKSQPVFHPPAKPSGLPNANAEFRLAEGPIDLGAFEATAGPEGLVGATGSWFDPASSGRGFNIQFIARDRFLIYFYGFSDSGERLWLVGDYQGEVAPGTAVTVNMLEATGGVFNNFDPDAVTLDSWGTLELTFFDCESASGSLLGSEGTEQLALTRLAGVEGLGCGG
ncbi:MAG: hypothetical protein AAF358_18980 [Pseudomonadota bacterium]